LFDWLWRNRISIKYAYGVLYRLIAEAEETFGSNAATRKLNYVVVRLQDKYEKVVNFLGGLEVLESLIGDIVKSLHKNGTFEKKV
jgi:hypothetical protein